MTSSDLKWSARENLALINYLEQTNDRLFLKCQDFLSQFCQPGRPNDFYSQKNCENQIRFILTQEGDLKTASKNFKKRCLAEYSESISAKRRRVETLEMFLEKIENRTINQREIEMLEQMIDFKSNNNSFKMPDTVPSHVQIQLTSDTIKSDTKSVQKQKLQKIKSKSQETKSEPVENSNDQKEVDPAWKKAAIMLWKQIADHKHASKFMNPVTDEIANKYSTVIKEPMDLNRVRKRIDQGVIRNSLSLQRDLLLIFQNAMMYNSSKTDIYRMALEMERDVNQQVADFIGTQMMVEIDA